MGSLAFSRADGAFGSQTPIWVCACFQIGEPQHWWFVSLWLPFKPTPNHDRGTLKLRSLMASSHGRHWPPLNLSAVCFSMTTLSFRPYCNPHETGPPIKPGGFLNGPSFWLVFRGGGGGGDQNAPRVPIEIIQTKRYHKKRHSHFEKNDTVPPSPWAQSGLWALAVSLRSASAFLSSCRASDLEAEIPRWFGDPKMEGFEKRVSQVFHQKDRHLKRQLASL